ncbi:TRAP transporter substrate-binding protein [Aquabacter spiritensis]|uniref:TRAP-type C4-dicarboxylate transport system substrate-binding protein n=1 Tax=Aquabacter spiritensis TaxID=933073 RepID=A0A4R3LX27_9HYPH|nr:TRAP transporter substrate-binding protein [Aquabacter spiritensis]TCT05123.1 TRAP-type C4-dicarboxylate transport system substrate-binding protein [Aquabacter spiritensis]
MKKTFLALAGAAVLVAGLSGAATAQTTWTMPTPYPDGNFHTKNTAQFAADVDKATDGALKIQLHSNGSLVKHPEIKAAVRRGTAQIGEVLISLHANESPIFGLDSIPFLATGYDAAKKLYAAQKPYLEKKLADENLVLLYSVPWPPQGIYSKKELKTIDELKGLKFRTYNPATQAIAKEAGAIPVQVEQADLATAFSTGRVEATITSPATGVDSKMWDFVSVYDDTQAWLPRNVVIVNKAAFDALTDAQKKAVMDAAKAAEERGWAASAQVTVNATKTLADNKISVVQPTPELKAGFEEIGKRIAAAWVVSAGPDGEAILTAYRK